MEKGKRILSGRGRRSAIRLVEFRLYGKYGETLQVLLHRKCRRIRIWLVFVAIQGIYEAHVVKQLCHRSHKRASWQSGGRTQFPVIFAPVMKKIQGIEVIPGANAASNAEIS